MIELELTLESEGKLFGEDLVTHLCKLDRFIFLKLACKTREYINSIKTLWPAHTVSTFKDRWIGA